MSVINVRKAIAPAQLAAELGAPITTRGGALDSTDAKDVEADVPEATLRAALDAHYVDAAWAATPEEATARALDARLDQALTQLQIAVSAAKPATAAAQASAAYETSRLCARVLVGLVRLHLRRLDSAD